MKARLLVDGFKEPAPAPNSIEAAIKRTSRNHSAEEKERIAAINAREAEQLRYATQKAYNIGINADPSFRNF